MITGGQSFVSSPPVFSHDGKKLLVCTGCTVSVFSISTGMLITELEGHTDRVTSIVVVPVNASKSASKFMNFCWTSSRDGTICYWDFSAPEMIKKVVVLLPIYSMVIPNIASATIGNNDKSAILYAIVSVENTGKLGDGNNNYLQGQIQIYNLTNSLRVGGLLAETPRPETLNLSRSGEYLGIKNKKKLHIWKIPLNQFKFDKIKKIKLHHTKKLSCLAFHPGERTVAGGDLTGRILIWRGFGRDKFRENGGGKVKNCEAGPGVRDNDDADSCSTWHWHSSEVRFLMFSSDGAYLFSGGKEGVIVVWQLDTGKKNFKPRFGSPLLYFTDSPDPSLSCVSCSDNQIHLLKMPTMEITKSITGIKSSFEFLDSNCEFGYDRSNGLIALRTGDYCVQFFSLFDNIEVSQVQVFERNFQPVDDTTVYVSCVAISGDGSEMCTVDVKLPEEGLGGLVTLKFWTCGARPADYSLSTVIYEPHSDAEISDIAFRPGRSMAVSSSTGGNFKVWVGGPHVRPGDENIQKCGWRCQSVGSYKGRPMTAVAFSLDGSVLAVAAGTTVTLWDPDTNILVAVMGDSLSPIEKLEFVGNLEFLVSLSRGSKPQLTVWNVKTLSRHWSYKLTAQAVCCMENGPNFAVLALLNSPNESNMREKDGIILLFDVENPVPVSTWLVNKVNGGGLAFVKESKFQDTVKDNTNNKVLLSYINNDHEFFLFDPFCTEINATISKSARKNQVHPEESVSVGYTSIYGELPGFELNSKRVSDNPFVPSDKPWETIFSGSSHSLPSLTKLCSVFLESLLEKKPISKE